MAQLNIFSLWKIHFKTWSVNLRSTCHCPDLQLRKVGYWGCGRHGSLRLPQSHGNERRWRWNSSIRSKYWSFCLTNDFVIIFADAFLIPQQTSVISLGLLRTLWTCTPFAFKWITCSLKNVCVRKIHVTNEIRRYVRLVCSSASPQKVHNVKMEDTNQLKAIKYRELHKLSKS